MTADAPPPEAGLIREKRRSMVPALSMARAAATAAADGLGPFSAALWTQIENGYQQTAQGPIPCIGTPERIARMARVTGATPAELERAGRPDAAQVLRRLATARHDGGGRKTMRERLAQLEQMARELREQLEEEEGGPARFRA